ncbi:MAG: response regulator [Lautropia sp.]|nr:response regulator [Lautropia sp.]
MWKTPFNPCGQSCLTGSSTLTAETSQLPFRVAAFGLGQRFMRLIELIFQCEKQNPHRYQLADTRRGGEFDIALVNLTIDGGVDTARRLRSLPRAIPVIGVGRRANRLRGADDLLFASFAQDILTVLNRSADLLVARAHQYAVNRSTLSGSILPTVCGRMPVDVPLRILVMDPSPSSRSHVAVGMRQLGVDVDGVGTLEQASDVLSMRHYDMILVDPQQPDGCGLEMMRRFRRATGSSVPVVVLSDRSGISDLLRSALAGCSGYLVKPLSMASLHGTVQRILLRTVRRQQRGGIGSLDAQAPDGGVTDATLRVNLMGRLLGNLRSRCRSSWRYLKSQDAPEQTGALLRVRGGGDGAWVDSCQLNPSDIAVWRPGSSHCAVELTLSGPMAAGLQKASGTAGVRP